jgi:hypothetical protein
LIDQLQFQALGAWNEIHPGKPKPQALDHLFQSRDYIIVFWFERGSKSGDPVLISKIPRTKNFNHYAERSIKLVNRLLADLKPPIRETLPTRVIAGQVGSLTHIVMGNMPGEPITIPNDNFLGRRAAEKHLSAFLAWLVEFQAQATIGTRVVPWDVFFKRSQDGPGLDFFGGDPYQRITQQIVSHLPIAEISFTWSYGDANHSNILMEQGQISGAIDWIGVEQEQWFYTDWYYFLFFYAFEFFKKNSKASLDTKRRSAISTTMGIGDYWLTRLFAEKTLQFLASRSTDPQLSPELFLTFLHDLHWPQGKGQLLKEAYSIYGAEIWQA